ncbi:hypothetical protein MG296_07325 [Flavobacteriaceae bacterium TK19130]|nr:hypothetical protein [Thermobacterium salinum]
MSEYLIFTAPVTLLEIAAALLGIFYLNSGARSNAAKLIVYFLCLTALVEIVGSYAALAYFSNYTYFSFVENTPFVRNYWLYNIYNIVAVIVYCEYFRRQLAHRILKSVLLAGMVLFTILEVANLFIHTDIYFNAYTAFSSIGGTVLVLFAIGLYYYHLLNSNDILEFTHHLPFYISIGAILLHITHTPLFIYSNYFNEEKGAEFVDLYRMLMLITNVLVYLTYAIGFLLCRRKKDSSSSILL